MTWNRIGENGETERIVGEVLGDLPQPLTDLAVLVEQDRQRREVECQTKLNALVAEYRCRMTVRRVTEYGPNGNETTQFLLVVTAV